MGFGLAAAIFSIAARIVISKIMEPDKPDNPRLAEKQKRGIRINTRDTKIRHRVVYGMREVAGNEVYINSTGTDNKYLWIVDNLAEGECEGIYQSGGVDQLFLNGKLWNQFGGNVSYWFYSGSATQTYNTSLHGDDPNWTENKRYTCYIVWRLTYNRDYFQAKPNRTVVLKGKRVYDFRDSTTKWSDNPVLCLYDYMTNTRYGMGIDSAKIDTTSWTSAANYCDTKGWTLNMVIDGEDPPADVRDKILQHFRGTLIWWDGKYYLHYADLNYETPVMTLTDEHILQDESGKAAITVPQPSMWKKPDGLRVRYANPDTHYVEDHIVVGDSDGVIDDLFLEGCTDRQMAAKLGIYHLERARLDRQIQLTARGDAIKLDPQDPIYVTSSAMALSNQLMRVKSANIRPDGLIDLSLVYESTDLYNDVYDINPETVYTTTLPDPTSEPPGVGNASIAEETYSYRGRTMIRLSVSFDSPSDYPWFDKVEVWLSYDDVTYEHQFDSTNDFVIENVAEGTDYYLKLRTVSIWGTKQSLTNATKLHRNVVGVSNLPPASLSGLTAVISGNVVNLYAERVNAADVELYVFRLGSSWSGAIELGGFRSPNMSLQGVKPGSHTFAANVLGTNGLWGSTPRFASATLADPPDGWTVQTSLTKTEDYSSGTFDNTEQTTYNSEYYLKCSHSGGVLTGTYTSQVYDLGASDRYLTYILADIVVTGAGSDWDSIVPAGTTWDQANVPNRTWAEIFSSNEGPSVKMTLLYGDTNPPTNEVSKMEILSAIVTGRYFQVKIEITDPSSEVNALVEHYTLKFCQ